MDMDRSISYSKWWNRQDISKKMKIGFLKFISLASIIFIIFVFFLALDKDNKYSTEKIVGKKIDNFTIKFLLNDKIFTNKNLKNENYHLINIWASWCLPCKKEHPMLMKLKGEKNLEIIGVNYKDKKSNAKKFLKEMGNPYDILLSDVDGKNSITFGVFGVPESILVNREHIIIKKIIGPIGKDDYENIIKFLNEK